MLCRGRPSFVRQTVNEERAKKVNNMPTEEKNVRGFWEKRFGGAEKGR